MCLLSLSLKLTLSVTHFIVNISLSCFKPWFKIHIWYSHHLPTLFLLQMNKRPKRGQDSLLFYQLRFTKAPGNNNNSFYKSYWLLLDSVKYPKSVLKDFNFVNSWFKFSFGLLVASNAMEELTCLPHNSCSPFILFQNLNQLYRMLLCISSQLADRRYKISRYKSGEGLLKSLQH